MASEERLKQAWSCVVFLDGLQERRGPGDHWAIEQAIQIVDDEIAALQDELDDD